MIAPGRVAIFGGDTEKIEIQCDRPHSAKVNPLACDVPVSEAVCARILADPVRPGGGGGRPVYPDLVVHSADGQVETVKYQVLNSMRLNQVQRQHAEIHNPQERIAKMEP